MYYNVIINILKGEKMNKENVEISKVSDVPEEPMTVSPEMLLAQIVSYIGEDFVVIPTGGWAKIVETIKEYDSKKTDENLLDMLQNLGVSVIPVSLAPKEESSIIMPSDIPQGNSKIIV